MAKKAKKKSKKKAAQEQIAEAESVSAEAQALADSVLENLEEAAEPVHARGPGAPDAKEWARMKRQGKIVEHDPKDLAPYVPGVDLSVPTPAQREDPRLADDAAGRAHRRRQALYERRRRVGREDRRSIVNPLTGETTSGTTSQV